MISIDLAAALSLAGVRWDPAPGDRFVVRDRDMDEDVFVLSEMTVDVQRMQDDQLLRFNGTTEWALDSVLASDVVWLPRESQLRGLLGAAFVALTGGDQGWQVTTQVAGRESPFEHEDAEQAYALALLDLVAAATADVG